MIADILSSTLVVVGALFALLAAIGLVRFPDIYLRMHAATKAGTLGAGSILLGLAFHAGQADVTLKAVLGIVFLVVTAPIAAHLLGRAAYCSKVPMWSRTTMDELDGCYDQIDQPPKSAPLRAADYE